MQPVQIARGNYAAEYLVQCYYVLVLCGCGEREEFSNRKNIKQKILMFLPFRGQ